MEGFKSSLDQAKEVSEATANLERITSSLDGSLTDASSTPTDADSVTSSSRHDSASPAAAGYDMQVRPGPRYRIVTVDTPLGQQVIQQVVPPQQTMHVKPGAKRKYYMPQSNTIEGYDGSGECMYPLDCVGDEAMSRRNAYCSQPPEPKIPRPPNAFMIYANEFRRVLAAEYPKESNKEISVRLGTLWKHMTKDAKDKYFGLSRVVDAEHKKRYPNYVYNPKEARMRKAIRDQNREHNRLYNGKSPSPTKQRTCGNNLIMQAADNTAGKPHHVRVLDKPRKMPTYHQQPQQQQQWQEGGGGNNQYVGAEAFLEMPFQSHDGGAYSSLVSQQAPWYPYMQQDGTPQYPHQVWSHHAPPAYAAQQRVQYMAAHSGQDAAAQQGYINYEPAAAHQPAPTTRTTNGVDTSSEAMPITTTSTPSTSFQEQRPNMTTAPTGTAHFPRPPITAASAAAAPSMSATTATTKPQQPPLSASTQTPTYPVSPQMSPTKAYHKYLQGNELSPTTNWPSLYCTYSPQDEGGRLAVVNHSPAGMPGEKAPFSYYNDNPPHQFTYYDYIVPGQEFVQHGQNFGNAVAGFTPQPFPPVSKAREFALGLREFITPSIKKRAVGFPHDEDPLSIAENAVLNSPSRNSPDEYTVVVNVVNDDTARPSGGRVIATYETQNNAQNVKNNEKDGHLIDENKAKGSEKLRDNRIRLESDIDLADNSTFSFMQDPAYKNILKSIDGNDNSKIIQQNDNVCVMTNDVFDDQRSNFSCMSPGSNPDDPAK